MYRIIQYELNPTKAQKQKLKMFLGCCRFVYNMMLDRKIKTYKEENKVLSEFDLINQLPKLKEEYPFLKDCPSAALQQTIHRLIFAYKRFFKGNGFPKFKKKGYKESFKIPVKCLIDYNNWTVSIAKIGKTKIYKGNNKQISGRIKSYTVIKTTTDRYFINILFETKTSLLNNNKTIGIDLGIKDFAVLSNGIVFKNHKYFNQNIKQLRILNRKLSRQHKKEKPFEEQSNNYKKTLYKIRVLHEHIANQRRDFCHKVSSNIASNYSTVCIETLSIKDMVKDKKLAGLIHDCGWGMFIEMLEYKCDRVIKIDKYIASSQICNICGYRNSEIKNLNIRKWTCPKCGTCHSRDLNAAKNIEREGLSLCEHKVSGYTKLAPEQLL